MYKRIIVVSDHDMIGYPPTISLINTLLSLQKKVVYVGVYSDKEGKEQMKSKGVQFYELDKRSNFAIKNKALRHLAIIKSYYDYKNAFDKIIEGLHLGGDDLIWFLFSPHVRVIYKTLMKYNYFVQFYEFVNAENHNYWKFLTPSYKATQFLRGAKAVIHCEYNRAAIMNGMYGVKGKINVLPNKPVIDETQISNVPENIQELYEEVKDKIGTRKAILYLGMFNSAERRLEEFCEAMKILPSDYVFIAMGGGDYWKKLQEKYNSDRYIFIPFVKPPYHLLFNRLIYIGVLNYLPVPKSVADVINPIYCAPNKIFEYTKYGKPIICNDIPALRYVVEKYSCGAIAENPLTEDSIVSAVKEIAINYESFSNGAKKYYDSVDLKTLIKGFLDE